MIIGLNSAALYSRFRSTVLIVTFIVYKLLFESVIIYKLLSKVSPKPEWNITKHL